MFTMLDEQSVAMGKSTFSYVCLIPTSIWFGDLPFTPLQQTDFHCNLLNDNELRTPQFTGYSSHSNLHLHWDVPLDLPFTRDSATFAYIFPLKHMEVSWNGGTPKSFISRCDFPYYNKLTILGIPHLWKVGNPHYPQYNPYIWRFPKIGVPLNHPC